MGTATTQGSTLVAAQREAPLKEPRPHRGTSLLNLISLIVHSGDRGALRELHDHRSVLRLHDGPALRPVEFIRALLDEDFAHRLAGHDAASLDRAYDLTVDKFSNLPPGRSESRPVKRAGPDCRLYLKAVLDAIGARCHAKPFADDLEEEMVAASMLQRHIVLQFCQSCREAKRSVNRTRTRYGWSVRGQVLYVWMPNWLGGRRRRAWLEANVPDVDPMRPGELQRIQRIVDERLGVPDRQQLCERDMATTAEYDGERFWFAAVDEELTVHGLARVVADEKASASRRQRGSIRALGREGIRRLVARIFEALCTNGLHDHDVAAEFGLSKATFSRFSGSLWRRRGRAPIPDLWLNTARVLAASPSFVVAVRAAGVWERIDAMIQATESPQ